MNEILTSKVTSEMFAQIGQLPNTFAIQINPANHYNNQNRIATAVAIIMILYVRKNGRKIVEDSRIESVDPSNHLREVIDNSLAVLSNDFTLRPVYDELTRLFEETHIPALFQQHNISAQDVLKSYLFDL